MGANDDYYNMIFADFLHKIAKINRSPEVQLEEDIYVNVDADSFSRAASAMLMTIAAIHQKWLSMKNDTRYLRIRMNYTEDFWFKDVMERVEHYKNKNINQVLSVLAT